MSNTHIFTENSTYHRRLCGEDDFDRRIRLRFGFIDYILQVFARTILVECVKPVQRVLSQGRALFRRSALHIQLGAQDNLPETLP
jgi:hypothetical protein